MKFETGVKAGFFLSAFGLIAEGIALVKAGVEVYMGLAMIIVAFIMVFGTIKWIEYQMTNQVIEKLSK